MSKTKHELPPGFSISSDATSHTLVGPGMSGMFVELDDAIDYAWKKFEDTFKISKRKWRAIKKAAELFPELLKRADEMSHALKDGGDDYITWSNFHGVDDVARNLKDLP